MSIYAKLTKSIKRGGITRPVRVGIDLIQNIFYDLYYKIDTSKSVEVYDLATDSKNKSHGTEYATTYTRSFKKLMNILKLSKELAFVDLGSGKGKVLFLASQYGYKKIIGIEFSEGLCEIARKNLFILQEKHGCKSEINIVCTDASEYKMEGSENIFYFNNPFDEVVLDRFLKNLVCSLNEKERLVCLIFVNTKCHNMLLKEIDIFRKYGSYVFGSSEYTVYFNKQRT